MSYTKLEVKAIGFEANQVLQRNSSLEVYGTSSRGIYLQAENDLTLFASCEDFHGPLTINFLGDPEGLLKINPRTIAYLHSNKIVFPEAELELSINNPEIWVPPAPKKFKGLQKNLLDDLFQQTKTLVGDNPFFPLLEMVFTATAAPLPGFPDFFKQMVFLNKSIQSGKVSNLAWEIEKRSIIAFSLHWIIAAPGSPLYGVATIEDHLAEHEGVADIMDELYLRKLDLADEVVLLAIDGYVGEPTSRAI